MFSKIGKVLLLIQVLKVESKASATESKKIVGGESSPIDYAYLLSMQRISSGSWRHFCGGVIIDENNFLTAAHCVKGFNTSQMSVFAGTRNLNDELKGVRRNVSMCIVHPDYVEVQTSDIALCKISIPWVFNGTVNKVKLDQTFVGENVDCLLTGWGSIFFMRDLGFSFLNNLIYPTDLRRSNFLTMSNAECRSKGFAIDDTQICTQPRLFKGACAG